MRLDVQRLYTLLGVVRCPKQRFSRLLHLSTRRREDGAPEMDPSLLPGTSLFTLPMGQCAVWSAGFRGAVLGVPAASQEPQQRVPAGPSPRLPTERPAPSQGAPRVFQIRFW